MNELVSQALGRYIILSLLGEGGMGAVFKAHDPLLERAVAIKVMHAQYLHDLTFRQRFQREARAAAGMNHAGIVKVHDFGEQPPYLYIVMQFIPGDNLRQMLDKMKAANQRIKLGEATQLVRQLFLALHYLHQQGILHPDIKLSNIMLEATPVETLPYQPVLTDLGLAKLIDESDLTFGGTTLGTPAYASSEQTKGTPTDARSDVYSAGVLLYELATGDLPFPIQNFTEASRYHVSVLPPAPRTRQSNLSPALEEIILQALEKDPSNCFADARAMATAPARAVLAPPADTTPAGDDGAVSLLTQYQRSLVEPSGSSWIDDFPTPPSHAAQDSIAVRIRSTNGTSLAGAKLLEGMAEAWSPDRPLRVSGFTLRLQSAKRACKPNAETEMTAEPRVASAAVTLEIAELRVEPSNSVTATAVILNQGQEVDHYQVGVIGVQQDWIAGPLPVLQLMPQVSRTVSVALQPPRMSQSRAGRYPVTIQIISQNAPSQVAEAKGTLSVGVFQHFQTELHPQRQSSLVEGKFQLLVKNLGNADLTDGLTAVDLEEACLYSFDTQPLTLAAGEERTVQLTVHPKVAVQQEQPKHYLFTMFVQPTTALTTAKQVLGVWVHTPPVVDLTARLLSAAGAPEGAFMVTIANRGESELSAILEASDMNTRSIGKFELWAVALLIITAFSAVSCRSSSPPTSTPEPSTPDVAATARYFANLPLTEIAKMADLRIVDVVIQPFNDSYKYNQPFHFQCLARPPTINLECEVDFNSDVTESNENHNMFYVSLALP